MRILEETAREFLRDDCPRMAAALSYYTMFSLPGLLLLIMLFAGLFADPEEIRSRILEPIRVLIGARGAAQVREILESAERPGAGNPLVVLVGGAALLFAATGAFAQLQGALNRIWQVAPDPGRRGAVRSFLAKRVLSFFMILGLALLLLASTVASTMLTALGDTVRAVLPAPLTGAALQAVSLGLTLLVATVLFGLLFHILPDARVAWRDAWSGAAATGALFLLGNLLLGLYLGRSDPGSAFGAAGALALILVWLYYSANIFFFGAELTQVIARRRGEEIRPAPGAVRVVIEQHVIREDPQ
ncbi:MAG TPA: YihY/virulence factor BrkB family protein [Longimicrobiales bacterium]|nr:YihY/virulence factor BrkB family protein [Longimicrobiales bacterium]